MCMFVACVWLHFVCLICMVSWLILGCNSTFLLSIIKGWNIVLGCHCSIFSVDVGQSS